MVAASFNPFPQFSNPAAAPPKPTAGNAGIDPNQQAGLATYLGDISDQTKQANEAAQQNDAALSSAFGGALSQLGGLLASLFGAGGGGGKGAVDLGPQLGLKRDELSAQNQYLQKQQLFANVDTGQQQQLLNLQEQQGKEGYQQNRTALLGSSAARGSLGTAGVRTQGSQLATQFQELMQRMGISQQQITLGQDENDAKFAYANQRNTFAKEGLDIQAGNAGYQNPFGNLPGPVPVPKK